jgi:hypothetical protein
MGWIWVGLDLGKWKLVSIIFTDEVKSGNSSNLRKLVRGNTFPYLQYFGTV